MKYCTVFSAQVLISIQSLLTDPYCDVCMEPEVGGLYRTDREVFDQIARQWTWRYAMHDVLLNSDVTIAADR